MTRREKRLGLSIVELLVVVGAVAILCVLLLPPMFSGGHGGYSKIALAKSMLGQLETALADYMADHGVYPPEKTPALDKCSETLYFYLAGMDITAPTTSLRKKLRQERRSAKVYFEFMSNYLEDYDHDGNYEVVDPWGQPWIYVRGAYPGKPGTSLHAKPLHNGDSYDLYSVGPDGVTGPSANSSHWNAARRYEYAPNSKSSFYYLAADEYEDGMDHDDIANF